MRTTFFVLALAAVATASRVFLESPTGYEIPSSWEATKPDANADLRLMFALKQRNLDLLQETLLAVSDPKSDDYGHHLTLEDLRDLIGPNDDAFLSVMQFINEYDVSSVDPTVVRDYIVVHAPVHVVESMLNVKFLQLTHRFSGLSTIRTADAYSVSEKAGQHLRFIAGVHRLPADESIHRRMNRNSRMRSRGDDKLYGFPGDNIDPAIIYQYYNVTDQGVSPNNSMAVGEFEDQYYLPSDLAQFFTSNSLPNNVPVNVINNEDSAGIEASLDIQYIMATAVNVPTWFIYDSAGGIEFFEQVLNYFVTQGNTTDTPWIHSISYGEPEHLISSDLLDSCEAEFQKWGTIGRTIFFASGDSGAGCELCVETDPDYGADSPWVTSVGATYLDSGGEEGFYISGGGFSRSFARPSYQANAVEGFLNSSDHLPPSFEYDSKNRGYPDLAAFGSNFQVVVNGGVESIAGTSCASPTTAGIFALLNDIRLQNGMPTLGFLNPLLYQLGEGSGCFNDITTGDNHDECCGGFYAQEGWDAMSGFGSPNYGALKEVILNMIAAGK